ncbi:serine hydroxymethyltransferase [Candidatus Peregrinibacteria bacterium CG11_big_fil_rev_8_21_14_0_20_46_8]|nr:MAG: serine hydroxymethyltransferase [Candidatus Peregrinibacteria bacterium CG11_big_fil_rev_8_21_14_0_20_46_8]
MSALQAKDPAVYKILHAEMERQAYGLELIPSENYVSEAVLEAVGSIFTNKYSEGYPRKRYYGGQEFVDQVEELAIERAKKLFNAEHVNVQPYSGSPANTAVFFGLLEYQDTIMGLKLDQGGHITHGLSVSYSGKFHKVAPYFVDKESHRIDMDDVRRIAHEAKPKLIIAGYTAYPRDIDWKTFREIADEVGAIAMADISHIAGLIAGGQLANPFDFGFDVVTTTTHKTLRGPRSAIIMCKEQYAKPIDKAVFPGLQGGPHDHVTAAKAVAFGEALRPEFKEYAAQIIKNAQALGESLSKLGWKLITGGTDNHLLLADMTDVGCTGMEAEESLDKAGITVNKNTVPYDPRKPFDPSGIRFGTPAITTRGLTEEHMEQLAQWMHKAVTNWKDDAVLAGIHEEVKELGKKFPVPGISL